MGVLMGIILAIISVILIGSVRKVSALPKTSMGIWSVGMLAYFLLAAGSFYALAEKFQVITSERLILAGAVSALAAGIAAFVLGVFAVVRKKERSITVFLAILIGGAVLIFLMSELIRGILGIPE